MDIVVTNWWLIVGASLHWASMFFQGASTADASALDSNLFLLVTPLSAIICALVMAAPRLLRGRRERIFIEGISLAGSAATLLAIPRVAQGSPAWDIILLVALAVSISALVLLWGFAFASLEKRTAGRHTACTAALSAALAFAYAGLAWGMNIPLLPLETCSRIASAAILLSGRVTFADIERSPQKGQRPQVVRFLGWRLCLGIMIGLFYGVALTAVLAISLVPAFLGCAIAVLMGICKMRGRGAYEVIPLMPLGIVGAYLVLFTSGDGTLAVAGVCASCIWICWIIVSSFQLSGLKETFGIGEIRLSATEKTVLLGGWTLGLVLNRFVPPVCLSETVAALIVLAALLWATGSSMFTAYNRQEDELIERVEAQRAERLSHAIDTIAHTYGLTDREAQVALLMAQGYSRPFICKKLSISDGTVRAHSTHIYSKLGIHRRDELLDLVRETEKSALA